MTRNNIYTIILLMLFSLTLIFQYWRYLRETTDLELHVLNLEQRVNFTQSFVNFFIRNLVNEDLGNNWINDIELVDINNNIYQCKDLLKDEDCVVVFFPLNACPSCYNIEALKGNSVIKSIILSPLSKYIDLKIDLEALEINTNHFAYFENSIPAELNINNPFIAFWDRTHNKFKYVFIFPKQIQKDMIELYIDSIIKNR